MAVSNLASLQIASLNGTPAVSYSTGEGAPGFSRSVDGFVTALSGDSIGSTYLCVRVPTNAKIKLLRLNSAVATAGAANIGVRWSNSAMDGTQVSNQGAVINATFFASAQSLVGTGQNVDVTFQSGVFTFANINTPLYVALSLGVGPNAVDPGGFIDIYLTLTTAVTTGGTVGLAVSYVV